jgi:hypothetical protein
MRFELQTLAVRTINRLRSYFAKCNHHPSDDQWSALVHLAETLEAMARGEAAPKVYLSSLDPGVGKSRTVATFIDTLLESTEHQHVGVLLCVYRLTEIERMVDEIGIPREMLCVRTSDARLNALGSATPDEARVLITTQQMIERRLDGRSMDAAGIFQFNGKARQVRIWDESFLPGMPITISAADLGFVMRRVERISPALLNDVADIMNDVRSMPSGSSRYAFPDLAEKYPTITLNDLLATAESGSDSQSDQALRADEQAVMSAIWFLAGKTVTIRKDGAYGNAVIDYRETLPDMGPMVILDASGRVRATYSDMEKERGLVRLRTATKRYDNLTVHTWLTGGGKSAFERNGGSLAAGIAKTIDTKPTQKWLVVCHRRDSKVGDVAKEVMALLSTTPKENIRFITWGNHSATNDFADVPNIVLAGTLYYRSSYYEGLKRLAAGRRAADGQVTDDEVRQTELGEHAHLVLQALCRGVVRKCKGEGCHKADAYIIASARSGIPAALPTIFPGCKIERWSPIPRKLSGDELAARDYIQQWAASAAPGGILAFKTVQRDLNISKDKFKDSVRRSVAFCEELSGLGVQEYGKGRYSTGYRIVSAPFPDLAGTA